MIIHAHEEIQYKTVLDMTATMTSYSEKSISKDKTSTDETMHLIQIILLLIQFETLR